MMNYLSRSKWFVLLASLVAVGCGSGGKSNGGGGTPPAPVAIVPSAGVDKSVKVGDLVELNSNAVVVGGENFTLGGGNLEVKGKSTVPTDVVRINWTQLSGPPVALRSDGTNKATVRFNAPPIGAAALVEIIYQLTFQYANGTSADDKVTIRIERVNQTPQIVLGSSATGIGGGQLKLVASAYDPDGDITGFTWVQTAGKAAKLNNATALEPTLTLPDVVTEEELTFELKVTDNNAAVAAAVQKVKVLVKDAPRINVFFPHTGSNYLGNILVVTGNAAANNADITSVQVRFAGVDYPATIAADGSWRVGGITIAEGQSNLQYSVLATDSLGRQSRLEANLVKQEPSSSDRLPISEVVNFAVDELNKRVILLASGRDYKDVKLVTVNLETGKQSAPISDFSILAQGVNSLALTDMVWDAARNKVYVASAPNDPAQKVRLISIDMSTGQRSVLSDSTRGTGPEFVNPTSLSLGQDNQLYVADNGASTLVAVDVTTGNRITIADSSTLQIGIDAPSTIAYDPAVANGRLFFLPYMDLAPLLAVNLANTPATSSVISRPSSTWAISEIATDLEYNPKTNEVLSLQSNDQLERINVGTGIRTLTRNLLVDTSNSRYSLDTHSQLLYVTSGIFENLYALELVSGQAVLISRNN